MLLSVFYLINESHRIDFILLELVWDIFRKYVIIPFPFVSYTELCGDM